MLPEAYSQCTILFLFMPLIKFYLCGLYQVVVMLQSRLLGAPFLSVAYQEWGEGVDPYFAVPPYY